MRAQPIGIFDSGVGGLSVWKKIVSKLPHESTLYIADSLNAPYGRKTSHEVYQLSRRIVAYLISQEVKLIVIACNTSTVASLDRLREEYPHIPLVGIVPVIKTAAEVSKSKKIGVLSTSLTAKSAYQQRLIDQFAHDCEVTVVGTDDLVPFVDRGEVAGAALEAQLVGILQPFLKAQIDTLALGCSHFPFLKEALSHVLGDQVAILDSSAAVARQVGRVLKANGIESAGKPTYTFYTTGDQRLFATVSAQLLGQQFPIQQLRWE